MNSLLIRIYDKRYSARLTFLFSVHSWSYWYVPIESIKNVVHKVEYSVREISVFCINNYKNEIHDTGIVSSVSEIMSSSDIVTITIDSKKTAKDVANIIVKKKVGSVIVIDSKMQPLGIITQRDIIKRVCLKNISASKIRVEDLMSSPLITIMSYDSIDTASRIMVKYRIKHLIVLEEDNRIAGLLSVTDITKKLAKILLDDYKRHRSLHFAIDLS